MDIVQHHYPFNDHVFIYDNAPTHLKWAPDTLSARYISLKETSKKGTYYFGVKVNVIDNITGKSIYSCNGKVLKKKILITDAKFVNVTPQSLYFPSGHKCAGVFKGIKNILEERGINMSKLLAQCDSFKCKPLALTCCTQCILYN